jgi:hypothetical protein
MLPNVVPSSLTTGITKGTMGKAVGGPAIKKKATSAGPVGASDGTSCGSCCLMLLMPSIRIFKRICVSNVTTSTKMLVTRGAAGRNHVQRHGDSCDHDSTDGLAEELISAGELQSTDVNFSDVGDVEQGE